MLNGNPLILRRLDELIAEGEGEFNYSKEQISETLSEVRKTLEKVLSAH